MQDLATAMAVSETLIDYKRSDSSKPKASKGGYVKGGGDKNSKGRSPIAIIIIIL